MHLNLPWRGPLAPRAVEGAVTASDALAWRARRGRLTAATRIDLEPLGFLLEEVAGQIADAISGVIVAGRQLDPELREPLAHLARPPASRSSPSRPPLHCGPHDRSYVVATYDLLLGRAQVRPPRRHPTSSCASERSLQQAAAHLAGGVEAPTRSSSTPRGGWNKQTRRAAAIPAGTARPIWRPAGPPGSERGAGARTPSHVGRRADDDRGRGHVDGRALSARAGRLPSPTLHLSARHTAMAVRRPTSTPPRACRSANKTAFLPSVETDALFLCNRDGNGIDALISAGIGAAASERQADDDTSPATSACCTTLAASPRCASSRHPGPDRGDRRSTAAASPTSCLRPRALAGEEYEALLGTPRGVSAAKAADLFDLPHKRAWRRFPTFPTRSPQAQGLIEVRVDRDGSVEEHRAPRDAVSAALSS